MEETLGGPFLAPELSRSPTNGCTDHCNPPEPDISNAERTYQRWWPSIWVEAADGSQTQRCQITTIGATSCTWDLVAEEEKCRQSPRGTVTRVLGTAPTARSAWSTGRLPGPCR
ncbi:hypothetical protein NDU88_001593 [Pleurodeles waltl]|uniref:Uncharacterized protein n=1 Tax=Pleurodeles waltl TaxID=8319 RepID=A0AAV7R7N6_PLEWA|nr:hypothetical protein NDU88_001593 [Pleurodeles waltl]